jgi:hypothetical protein
MPRAEATNTATLAEAQALRVKVRLYRQQHSNRIGGNRTGIRHEITLPPLWGGQSWPQPAFQPAWTRWKASSELAQLFYDMTVI